MTGDGSKIYIYNALNQFTQVKRASDNAVIATYAYNHDGLRKSKTVNGVTTTYNWDASGNLIRETTSGSSTYFYYIGGKLVGLKKNNTTYIVHDNLRGDVESITDVNGNIVAQAHYDPWGNQISTSGNLVQPLRYAGYYYDEETGLYYLKSRYYSPQLGRFLTKDGIRYISNVNPETLNLYSYCRNNPVSLTDPNGNWADEYERGNALADGWDIIDIIRMDIDGYNYNLTKDPYYNQDANRIRAKYSYNAYYPSSSSSSGVLETAKKVHNAIQDGADALEPGGVSNLISGAAQNLSQYPPPIGTVGKVAVAVDEAVSTAGNIDDIISPIIDSMPEPLHPIQLPPGYPDCRNNRNVNPPIRR